MKDDTELFKQFQDNDSFKKWLSDTIFKVRVRKTRGEPIKPSFILAGGLDACNDLGTVTL